MLSEINQRGLDNLPNPLHIRLRANREDVTLPDSHGQIWAEAATLASIDDTLFRGSHKEVESEMVEILGLAGKTRFPTRRLVTLWRNKNWREMITRWCSFPLGQATFNITAFEWLVSCRLDDVSKMKQTWLIKDDSRANSACVKFWFSSLNKAIDSATRVRRGYGIEIEPQDWIKLAVLSEKSSDRDAMALFYPELDGDPYFDTPPPRRLDFLTALNDEKYKELYDHILTRPILRFPNVHSLIKTNRQEGKAMSAVIAHVGHWLNKSPTVIQERNASKPLLRKDFLPALEKRHGKNANAKSIELEHQVLTYVREQIDTLTDETAEHFLDEFPIDTKQEYIGRFNHSTWKNILVMVHTMVGPHFQNEAVIRFNTEDPNTIRSKPLNTIVHGVCDFISRNPEVSQSHVLSRKPAIEMLHAKLRPMIVEWAVEQYDQVLKVSLGDWQPAELAKMKMERSKYAVLRDAEVESDGSASSRGTSPVRGVGMLGGAVERPASRQRDEPTMILQRAEGTNRRRSSTEAVSLEDSTGSESADVEVYHNIDGVGRQSVVLKRGGKPHEHTKQGQEHRYPVAGTDALPKEQPRPAQSVKKSWRGRMVAQASSSF